jgi:hypothetical protein
MVARTKASGSTFWIGGQGVLADEASWVQIKGAKAANPVFGTKWQTVDVTEFEDTYMQSGKTMKNPDNLQLTYHRDWTDAGQTAVHNAAADSVGDDTYNFKVVIGSKTYTFKARVLSATDGVQSPTGIVEGKADIEIITDLTVA